MSVRYVNKVYMKKYLCTGSLNTVGINGYECEVNLEYKTMIPW